MRASWIRFDTPGLRPTSAQVWRGSSGRKMRPETMGTDGNRYPKEYQCFVGRYVTWEYMGIYMFHVNGGLMWKSVRNGNGILNRESGDLEMRYTRNGSLRGIIVRTHQNVGCPIFREIHFCETPPSDMSS